MKITRAQLKQIIKEELEAVLEEQPEDSLEEYYGAGHRYDCEKECRGSRNKESCIKFCDERKRAESDRRAEKSMSRGW